MKSTIARLSLFAITAMAASVTAAEAQTWTGGYVGLSAGSSKISDHKGGLVFDTNQDGVYGDTVKTMGDADYFSLGFCSGAAKGQAPAAGCQKDGGKGGFGVRAGYDWQAGHWVYGGLVDVSGLKLRDSVSAFSTAPDAYTFSRELKTLTAIRGRLGWSDRTWLLYATAGLASANMKRSFATTNALNSFMALRTKTSSGAQLGLGGEWAFARNWRIGVEYLSTSLRDHGPVVLARGSSYTFASNPFLIANAEGTSMRRSDDRLRFGTVSLTLTYRLGAM